MKEQSEFLIDKDGTKVWYLPSKDKTYYHRLDGPALKCANGTKIWSVDGQLHRLDGPALEYANGLKIWYVDGNLLNTAKVEEWLEENKIDLKTEAGQMALKLRWA